MTGVCFVLKILRRSVDEKHSMLLMKEETPFSDFSVVLWMGSKNCVRDFSIFPGVPKSVKNQVQQHYYRELQKPAQNNNNIFT